MENSQSLIRIQIRQLRRSLPRSQQNEAARRLKNRLMQHPLFLSSRRIAFYLTNDGEIDPKFALQYALNRKKSCYLPVLYRGGENRLLFGRVRENSSFRTNKYGIPEPDIAQEQWVFSSQLDLVLAPLVAFDREGNRIGMGGGYYDRSLKQLKSNASWQRPYVLGLAHQFQQVDSIGSNAWDIPLRGVVTDLQTLTFNF